jgi:phosphatidylinositol glycan class O
MQQDAMGIVDVDPSTESAPATATATLAPAIEAKERYNYRSRKLTETNTSYVRVMALFAVLQTIALTFFTRGFLLSRSVLPDLASCESQNALLALQENVYENNDACFHPAPFNKAVILIIDALRFDFTIPVPVPLDGSSSDANYHNNFNVFYDAFQNHPENSLLLKFIADPPTTTLQRLKGLTTGSLPTFIDAGSNFDGDTVLEDNLLSQFFHNNKSVAFTGDDTWTAMFSPFINQSLCYPYDSLNVWDLHSVDNGVIEHLFPLLEQNRQQQQQQQHQDWDVLIGHFLGVDHCGHRYGPQHYAMKDKLQQLNDIVERVMKEISDDTLLVVFGDHGMDSTGNHGGESDDEVEAALFMYSKQKHFKHFKDENIYDISNLGKNYRSVNQIDITPTLAMLLGIPIPYNSLGSPIAEAFMINEDDYLTASMFTSAQINNYRESSNELKYDSDINTMYEHIFGKWKPASQLSPLEKAASIEENIEYQKTSLLRCKEKWANFDDLNIWIGILLILLSLIVLIVYSKLVPSVVVYQLNYHCVVASLILVLVYSALCSAFSIVFKPEGLPVTWAIVLGVALGISNGILAPIMDRYSVFWLFLQAKENLVKNGWTYCGVLLICMHSLIYASNSFIIWEDKIVAFWLITFGCLAFFKSFQLGDKYKRFAAAYHSFVFMLLVRLTSMITLCREEQGDKCVSNFKITWWSILLLYGSALILPTIIKTFYKISYSYEGPAPIWIGLGLRSLMFLIAIIWTLEYVENDEYMTKTFDIPFEAIKSLKITIGRVVLGASLLAANFGWNSGPLCVRVELQQREVEVSSTSTTKPKPKSKKNIQQLQMVKTAKLIGYGNVYGSSYFLLFLNILCSVLVVSKPLGGVSLFLLVNQILTLLELVDLLNIRTNLISVVVMCLLGYLHFFTTGHQATLQSIQWETGFMFTETITFPFTHLALVLNTLGPFILVATAIPLLTLWKIPPTNKPIALSSKIVEAAMTMLIYQTSLTLITLIMTNNFRRHLMVWKIFAPRFMLNALILFLMNIVLTFVSVGWSSVKVVTRWYDQYGG